MPIMATSRHATRCALCRDVAIIGNRIAQGWELFEEGWAGEGAMKLWHDGNGDAVSLSLFPLFFCSSIFDRQKKKKGGGTHWTPYHKASSLKNATIHAIITL